MTDGSVVRLLSFAGRPRDRTAHMLCFVRDAKREREICVPHFLRLTLDPMEDLREEISLAGRRQVQILAPSEYGSKANS